jgi:hypothetical protein
MKALANSTILLSLPLTLPRGDRTDVDGESVSA